jgi:diguanylate cyclase (GGDEF)-like protein
MNEPRSTSRSGKRVSLSVRFIEQYLKDGSHRKMTGLLLGQLDAFNRISTTFGHEKSEAFCAEHAQQLREYLPPHTPVIRLSERRFAVLVSLDSISTIIDVASEIAEVRQPHIQVDSDNLLVDVTLGVAVYPTHTDDAATLFRRAELALREAREKELTFEIYRPEATQKQTALWKFESDLDCAVQRGDLEVYYQPKLAVAEGRICGAEALVRWRQETGRLVGPAEFIPVAERSGSIVAITWLVFESVAVTAQSLSHLPKPFSISINVSPQVLDHADFFTRLARLQDALQQCEIALTLELTEDSLLESGDAAPAKLKRIRKLGIDLAIDDFGKGYSSLTYLKDLPATEIKIDKRFVGTVAVDYKDHHIVKAIIELAHAFDMHVVAEGVDNEESLAAVEELGCESAQGFFISRPMRSDLLVGWIEGYTGGVSAKTLMPVKGKLLSGMA